MIFVKSLFLVLISSTVYGFNLDRFKSGVGFVLLTSVMDITEMTVFQKKLREPLLDSQIND
jgi:hypothetical protein